MLNVVLTAKEKGQKFYINHIINYILFIKLQFIKGHLLLKVGWDQSNFLK